jgi:hypothetical protein
MRQAVPNLRLKLNAGVIPGRRSRTRNPVAHVVNGVSESRPNIDEISSRPEGNQIRTRRSGFRVQLRRPGMTDARALRVSSVLLFCLSALTAAPAHAACPQELAVYEDTSGNSLTFTPPNATQAAEHEFTLRLGTVSLQGVVMWSKDPDRPNGIVMDQCPEGDVTGAELDACTVWQGVIYGLTTDAAAPYLGKRGAPFAEALLLPDLSRYALAHAFKSPLAGPAKVDDVFKMKACQE